MYMPNQTLLRRLSSFTTKLDVHVQSDSPNHQGGRNNRGSVDRTVSGGRNPLKTNAKPPTPTDIGLPTRNLQRGLPSTEDHPCSGTFSTNMGLPHSDSPKGIALHKGSPSFDHVLHQHGAPPLRLSKEDRPQSSPC